MAWSGSSYREEYLRSIGPFRDAVLAILAAIAKQERVRLSERVQAGLSRAKAQGKVSGRPKAAVRLGHVLALRKKGLSLRAIAAETGVSVMTIQRIVEAASGAISRRQVSANPVFLPRTSSAGGRHQ
jgi:DNA invertase Pin-like site-specific DNA recombinase